MGSLGLRGRLLSSSSTSGSGSSSRFVVVFADGADSSLRGLGAFLGIGLCPG